MTTLTIQEAREVGWQRTINVVGKEEGVKPILNSKGTKGTKGYGVIALCTTNEATNTTLVREEA